MSSLENSSRTSTAKPEFPGCCRDFERTRQGFSIRSVSCTRLSGVLMADRAGESTGEALRLDFRFPSIRHGRRLLCRRPKSKTMALVGTRIRGMSEKKLALALVFQCSAARWPSSAPRLSQTQADAPAARPQVTIKARDRQHGSATILASMSRSWPNDDSVPWRQGPAVTIDRAAAYAPAFAPPRPAPSL